jgi:hypothetical protein
MLNGSICRKSLNDEFGDFYYGVSLKVQIVKIAPHAVIPTIGGNLNATGIQMGGASCIGMTLPEH